jgi:hypothetical protein
MDPNDDANYDTLGTFVIIGLSSLMFFGGFNIKPRQLKTLGITPILLGVVPQIIQGTLIGVLVFVSSNFIFTNPTHGPNLNV